MLIQRLAIIGVGLLGGSLARALKRANQCGEVVGCGRNTANLEEAMRMGIIDRYTTHIKESVKESDMVIVAVPLGTMATAFEQMADFLSPSAVITDVGSAKGSVVTAARARLGAHFPRFVPAHPLAGGEKTGAAASTADLFENRRVILTPVTDTDPAACRKVWEMWQFTGATVSEMKVEQHDLTLAATSHLPHLLAFTLVDMLAAMEQENKQSIFPFAATGFRDFSRIASSDPIMWRDICLTNRAAVLEMAQQFITHLTQLMKAVDEQDGKAIEDLFRRAKTTRDQFYL